MKYKRSFVAFCLGIVTITIALGTWQLARLQEKQTLLNNIRNQIGSPPIALNPSTPPPPFTKIKVTGYFTDKPQEQFLLLNRTQNGKVGYHLLRILHHENGAALINLGWVPDNYIAKPQNNNLSVNISGIIRKTQKKGRFTPENNLAANQWHYINIAQMQQTSGVNLANFHIATDNEFWQHIPNNHLQYALTWYAMGAVFLLMTIIAIRTDK